MSALQRAFFEAPKKETPSAGRMTRCASAPAIRESVASWHLSMIIDAISASPRHAAEAPAGQEAQNGGLRQLAGARAAHTSAVNLSVLSQ